MYAKTFQFAANNDMPEKQAKKKHRDFKERIRMFIPTRYF